LPTINGEQDAGAEPPPRFSARRLAEIRTCRSRSTLPSRRQSLSFSLGHSHTMKIPICFLKSLIWVYLSLGVLIILAIAFSILVLPSLSPDGGVSTSTLDLLEQILLYWGIILLPFLKIAQVYVKKHQNEKTVA
jgi:hypothetical protein